MSTSQRAGSGSDRPEPEEPEAGVAAAGIPEVGQADTGQAGVGELHGSDIARRALEEARAAARAAGKSVGQGRSKSGGGVRALRGKRRGWSGSGPDSRDPQPFGAVVAGLSKSRGWNRHVAEGTVMGRWDDVVGADVAAHAQPVKLDDGVLHVQAESTAWATQLRLMQSHLLGKITAAVGPGIVTTLSIKGPAAPSWRKGERHVPGRGPRDTYG